MRRQHRRAKREHDGEQPGQPIEREAAGVVAAEREQRDEGEVLRRHRRSDVLARDEHPGRADEVDERRIPDPHLERSGQVTEGDHVAVVRGPREVHAVVENRDLLVDRDPDERPDDEGRQ